MPTSPAAGACAAQLNGHDAEASRHLHLFRFELLCKCTQLQSEDMITFIGIVPFFLDPLSLERLWPPLPPSWRHPDTGRLACRGRMESRHLGGDGARRYGTTTTTLKNRIAAFSAEVIPILLPPECLRQGSSEQKNRPLRPLQRHAPRKSRQVSRSCHVLP